MTRIHKVASSTGTVRVGAADKLPDQIELTYVLAAEAIGRINDLEEQLRDVTEQLADLGGPVYAKALARYLR